VAKATMPEGEVKRKSDSKVGKLRNASSCTLKIGSIIRVDGCSEERLPFELEVDCRGINQDYEGLDSCEIQDREEIGLEIRYMKDSGELYKTFLDSINGGLKDNSANTSRIDNFLVCYANRRPKWLILVKPVAM
jgi:hypothetical protein